MLFYYEFTSLLLTELMVMRNQTLWFMFMLPSLDLFDFLTPTTKVCRNTSNIEQTS